MSRSYKDRVTKKVAREILTEVRAAFAKYGGQYGMAMKLNELEVRYGLRERDCRDCRYFVGCECFSGQMCDLFTEEKDIYES